MLIFQIQAEWTNKKLVWVPDEESGFELAQIIREVGEGKLEVQLNKNNKKGFLMVFLGT